MSPTKISGLPTGTVTSDDYIVFVDQADNTTKKATVSTLPIGTGTVTNVSSANTDILVANPTTTPVLTLSATIAHTDVGQTFSGTQNFTGLVTVNPAGTGTALTNPTVQATNSVNNFTQVSIQNKSTGVNASADLITYPDNNTNDTTGFANIGIAGSNFAQAAYAITTPNDAYFFGSAVSGAGKLGNLVIATDSTGSSNSIVFGVNGFNSLNKERARIDGATGTLSLGYQAVANGKLQFKNSTNSFTQTFTGSNPGASIEYILPTTAPTAGQVLSSTAPSAGVATLSWASSSGLSWGSSISGTSGTGLTSTISDSSSAGTIGYNGVIGNTQSNAMTLIKLDTGTSTVGNAGILIDAPLGTGGSQYSILVRDYASATQAVARSIGFGYNKNISFNTNSVNNAIGAYFQNGNNAGSGINTGIFIVNASTKFTTSSTNLDTGSGVHIYHYGVGGTAYSLYVGSNVNSSVNGLVNYALSNTQSGASVMQKIVLGTSAQGHTGLLVNAFNASSSISGIKVDLSTTGTGAAIRISGTGAGSTIGKIHFDSSIATGAAGGTGIYFSTFIGSSAAPVFGISMSGLNASSGTCYGLYQGELNRGTGTTYGLYQDTLTSAGSTGTSYGWYVANIQEATQTVASTSKYFSLNNNQSAVLANRSTDASEILFSRTNTATTGTKTDNFNLTYFKRTSVQNGAGGTFSTTGSVQKLENVATQTAGTLTDSTVILSLAQSNNSTGGHILFNAYSGTPTTNNTMWWDGTNMKIITNAGVTKTFTLV